MSIKVSYPDVSTEIIPRATVVDQQNFHEGLYAFYDERGGLLEQINMSTRIR